MDLLECRKQIDEIDRQMVSLFEERMKISRDVAEYKLSVGKKIYDKEREDAKIRMVEEMTDSQFNRHAVRELYSQLMSMSRKLQYTLIPGETAVQQFTPVEGLDITEATRVVYFGVPGSYTEQAMLEVFGDKVQGFNRTAFKDIMEAVQAGEADYGILPIENSSTGGIDDIYDLLVDYENVIVGQHIIKIRQSLLGLAGAKPEDIKTVYSHPQGILQCSRFLEKYPSMKAVEFASTAAGAAKVKEDQDSSQAAIGSIRAAEYYGLSVICEQINDEDTNSTRFIIITREKKYLEDGNLISLSLELPHTAGSLYNILSHIRFNGLNMTKIESRPLSGKPFEYRFFIDFQGNLKEPGVRNAIRGMAEEAVDFRILGNYKES
ncbi:prephenate dehydratase [Anaerolentibacter hominis]|uniref:prephenate dehydratase n=1 Tax=Anaerolentibacter hominis TaxID=3079009 RepID=UPI0031B80C37